MSYAISIRIPNATMDRLRNLCERLNISTTDAILNAIDLELQMLSTPPKSQRKPLNGKHN